MNHKDMTAEERAIYEKLKQREDTLDWLVRNLAILATITLITALIVLFA